MPDFITRIAKRVFLAFTCRRHVTENGFGYDGADKGVAAFDYRYQLLLWAYPKDGKVKVVYAEKADRAFYELCHGGSDSGLGEIGKEIKDLFRNRPRATCERNFKVLLWNAIMESQFRKFGSASFLVGRTETLDYDKAKALLTTQYDFSLKNFYAVFGGETSEELKFSCEGMDFEVNDSFMDKEQVAEKMRDVKSKLPSSLSGSLLYGNVEMKNKFAGNAIADYTPSDDTIRIDASDGFVTSMIHELGHRWHYKFCKPNQEKELMKLYSKCRMEYDDTIHYEYGDTIKLSNGDQYVIVGETAREYEYYKVDNEKDTSVLRIPKKYFTGRNVVSVNGQPIERYSLPRQYAGKNFREFVACCFEHVYGGRQVSNKVRQEFVKIVEG